MLQTDENVEGSASAVEAFRLIAFPTTRPTPVARQGRLSSVCLRQFARNISKLCCPPPGSGNEPTTRSASIGRCSLNQTRLFGRRLNAQSPLLETGKSATSRTTRHILLSRTQTGTVTPTDRLSARTKIADVERHHPAARVPPPVKISAYEIDRVS